MEEEERRKPGRRPVPEADRTVGGQISLTRAEWREIGQWAEAMGISRSAFIRRLVKIWMDGRGTEIRD